MLVERFDVAARQPMGVLGEVSRHPVQEHPNSMSMTLVHEPAEVFRASDTAGWRTIPGGLTTPGGTIRMFGKW